MAGQGTERAGSRGMNITRRIALEFESETCTQEELEVAAEYKLHDIRKSIGLSGIFPLRDDIKKKVIWHSQQDAIKT